MIIYADIQWIKSEYGGRESLPTIGLRPGIRFQKYFSEWMLSAWDVEIIHLDIDLDTWKSTSQMKLSQNAPPSIKGMKTGELIELLDSYRVIGIGKITETR